MAATGCDPENDAAVLIMDQLSENEFLALICE